MGRPIVDLTGQQFGRLKVLCLVGKTQASTSNMIWRCQCRCKLKTLVEVRGSYLVTGRSTSCGCLFTKERHGYCAKDKPTPTYGSWKSMHERCNNPKHKHYSDYGGRGITICKRWHKFSAFIADMGERPSGMTLDRKNVNGNYNKRNCRWATSKEQQFNTRKRLKS